MLLFWCIQTVSTNAVAVSKQRKGAANHKKVPEKGTVVRLPHLCYNVVVWNRAMQS